MRDGPFYHDGKDVQFDADCRLNAAIAETLKKRSPWWRVLWPSRSERAERGLLRCYWPDEPLTFLEWLGLCVVAACAAALVYLFGGRVEIDVLK